MVLPFACGPAWSDTVGYNWWTNLLQPPAASQDLAGADATTICNKAADYYASANHLAGGTQIYHAENIIPVGGGAPSGPFDFGSCHIANADGTQGYNVGLVPEPAAFYVQARLDPDSDNGDCCAIPGKSHVADPVNPATGNVFASVPDLSSQAPNSLPFLRFYNSTDSTSMNLGHGWRHSYSRSIKTNDNSATYQRFVTGMVDQSSLYSTAENACNNGFMEIRDHVTNWASATSSYAGGICSLVRNGVVIGTLAIKYGSRLLPPPLSTPIGLDAIRDDGMVVRFIIQNSVISAPPSLSLKLKQTSTGFTLYDSNDSVESYDANGKLLLIANRAGVVQTMSYDGSGRLTSVNDTLGHGLALSYDAQGRLLSVTRQ